MYPTLFISHGAPNVVLYESNTIKNFKEFSKKLTKPEFIIIFSAHYLSDELKIIDYTSDDLLYDFYGFEHELYKFDFDIKSDERITLEIMKYLRDKNIHITIDKNRTSYDHGVWTALSMLYDTLDIPVIQLSIPMNYTPKQLIKLGELLQVFKDQALLIASGGVTHNLKEISSNRTCKSYAVKFNEHIVNIINKGNENELLSSLEHELFIKNHPTNEHFLPLLVAFGNAIDKQGISFNSEIVYSNISMESFVFDLKQ